MVEERDMRGKSRKSWVLDSKDIGLLLPFAFEIIPPHSSAIATRVWGYTPGTVYSTGMVNPVRNGMGHCCPTSSLVVSANN